jgi:hypothetical protein
VSPDVSPYSILRKSNHDDINQTI